MSTCIAPRGFPVLTNTTNSCACSCQGHYTTTTPTAQCGSCNLRCLNGGKDNSRCLSTCTCPSSGSALYYGTACECKGIPLRSTLPITSEKFDVIKAKRAEVEVLVQDALQTNDMMSFLQRDTFKVFINSFLQSILADYRTTLLFNGVNTSQIYDYNPITQQYTITDRSLAHIVSLKNFEATQITTTPSKRGSGSGAAPTTSYTVQFTLLITALPQCYAQNAVVDDTHWASTLGHMNIVAQYLEQQDISMTLKENQDGIVDGNTVPIFDVYDPTCTNTACKSSRSNSAHVTMTSVVTLVAPVVLVMFLLA